MYNTHLTAQLYCLISCNICHCNIDWSGEQSTTPIYLFYAMHCVYINTLYIGCWAQHMRICMGKHMPVVAVW